MILMSDSPHLDNLPSWHDVVISPHPTFPNCTAEDRLFFFFEELKSHVKNKYLKQKQIIIIIIIIIIIKEGTS